MDEGCASACGAVVEAIYARRTVVIEALDVDLRRRGSGMGANGFRSIEPKILYFGTPVALISSLNEDGTTNLAPMSSFWALGWTMMLGLLDETQTAENLARDPECVINIPSPEMWQQVEKLAPLTGKDPVPKIKARQFRFEEDK